MEAYLIKSEQHDNTHIATLKNARMLRSRTSTYTPIDKSKHAHAPPFSQKSLTGATGDGLAFSRVDKKAPHQGGTGPRRLMLASSPTYDPVAVATDRLPRLSPPPDRPLPALWPLRGTPRRGGAQPRALTGSAPPQGLRRRPFAMLACASLFFYFCCYRCRRRRCRRCRPLPLPCLIAAGAAGCELYLRNVRYAGKSE